MWQCIFQRTCCLVYYPDHGQNRCPRKTFSTIYRNRQGHISEYQSLNLAHVSQYVHYKPKATVPQHEAQAHNLPKFLPSRYHVGCLFISVQWVVRHTVCTVRRLQLIVICCIHIHICRTGCYRYAMCTFRYIQPVIADTPIKKCSDTLQELTEHKILLHN